ncbi:GAF domain-containing protein [Wenjunlia tyrosinilytica]|jgi:GAF domain-containing protein|uniref:GAF domain-containing protein n=1 Tax=Wenjunlia tyrosinilytica TaxID=1544741 RepID=A0A917ZZ11_9ACTN|nr:GAF domain-containing protein [Wenjunlia tyrosinilytica]GGO99989.1 hypothetical protein GCM10012280_67690 [Wenjunlia tyrosinilytica]
MAQENEPAGQAVQGPADQRSADDPLARELLQSVVDVARALFGAQASSVFLLDEEADELVFEAVAGRGEEFLVGRRFPAGSGIAGWVAVSGEPMVVDDLSGNSSFDRSLAESTQYVPDSLMAAPLIQGRRVLGVLEVLDPAPQSRSSLGELDLLALFARQAAAALRVVVDRRAARGGTAARDEFLGLGPSRHAAALQLVGSLEQLLLQAVER